MLDGRGVTVSCWGPNSCNVRQHWQLVASSSTLSLARVNVCFEGCTQFAWMDSHLLFLFQVHLCSQPYWLLLSFTSVKKLLFCPNFYSIGPCQYIMHVCNAQIMCMYLSTRRNKLKTFPLMFHSKHRLSNSIHPNFNSFQKYSWINPCPFLNHAIRLRKKQMETVGTNCLHKYTLSCGQWQVLNAPHKESLRKPARCACHETMILWWFL